MRKFFFISPPRLPFPVIFSSPALIPSSPLTSLITILSGHFSHLHLLSKPHTLSSLSPHLPLLSPSHHPFTHPFALPRLLSTPSPLSIGTLPFHALLFLSHHTLTTYSTLHSSFPPQFTSSFSPHLSHPIHAKTQRDPKTRTTHKSINPPLHFYRFTFLRFYTFTENSQRKIHHPTPLDKHWSVNNPASYPGKDY